MTVTCGQCHRPYRADIDPQTKTPYYRKTCNHSFDEMLVDGVPPDSIREETHAV